jgi:hypothetical protein
VRRSCLIAFALAAYPIAAFASAVTGYGLGSAPVIAAIPPSSAPSYWIDYDSDNLTQSGGLVSAWADNGPANAPLSASGSARPAYTANAVNGHASVTGDGSTSWMASSVSPNPNSAQATLYMVGTFTSTTSAILFETTSNSSANNGLALFNASSAVQIAGFMGATSGGYTDNSVWINNRATTTQILTVAYDRTIDCTVCGNGTQQVHVRIGQNLESGTLDYQTLQTGNFAAGTVNLFARNGTVDPFAATVEKVLLFNTEHTPATQWGVDAWLAQKYGLSFVSPTCNIIVGGDSISSTGNINGDVQSWQDFIVGGGAHPTWIWQNWAFGGNWLSNIAAHATDQLAASVRPGVTNVAIIWAGTNDAANTAGLTASGFYAANVQPILTTLHGAGVTRIGLVPMLSRNNYFTGGVTEASFEMFRVSFNSYLSSQSSTGGFVVTSPDSNTGVLTAPGAYATSYFNPDMVHPTPTSKQTVEAPSFASQIAAWCGN